MRAPILRAGLLPPALVVASLILSLLVPGVSAAQAAELTFEDRVAAQRSIEQVYYSHQIGAKRPFDEAVPREILEKKVRTYLKQSVALEEYWKTPVTAAALRRESERIAANTRLPERVEQIYAALDHDPVLIQECFVRPALVDRLARSFFAYDERIHAGSRDEARELRGDLAAGRLDPEMEHLRRSELVVGQARSGRLAWEHSHSFASRPPALGEVLQLEPEAFTRWRSLAPEGVGEVGSITERRDAFVVRVLLDEDASRARVATYIIPKIAWDDWWSEVRVRFDEREARPAVGGPSLALAPEMDHGPRHGSTALLPGPAIDFGMDPLPSGPDDRPGDREGVLQGETGVAPPCLADDTWENGILDDTPEGRRHHTAVWTGTEMIVWGGWDWESLWNSGGRYDPLTDTWKPMSTAGAPTSRFDHTAVWTGSEMIVWGGYFYEKTGGRYDAITDTWRPTRTQGAPRGRTYHTAVWTGEVMIVWGGETYGGDPESTGGIYDPVTDEWSLTSTANAPAARSEHTAVWTGERMLVWGGEGDSPSLDSGGRYDPVTDQWTPIAMVDAPAARLEHTAVWTGEEMIVWGGEDGGFNPLRTGGRYDPDTDAWTATSLTDAPSGRFYHSAVWTGSQMVVWGGMEWDFWHYLDTGGRYDPVLDAWTPTSTAGAPRARGEHTAIWTGSLMVVWGGEHDLHRGNTVAPHHPNTGGRYEPSTDTWTPTSVSSAPAGRELSKAVWTGSQMVVWGGWDVDTHFDTGGRYDPLLDAWTPTSTAGAPAGRVGHKAVWTGSQMVVWGGQDAVACLETGGRYDPIADAWAPTTTVNAPSARADHTAVWTGSAMAVWGGHDGLSFLGAGALYDPPLDSWVAISEVSAPGARAEHGAVWSGDEMIVWGGVDASGLSNTGGRYAPGTDTWNATSIGSAPTPRTGHTAVWTGAAMVVWGGWDGSTSVRSGGRYDPLADAWSDTRNTHVLEDRADHTAVWTGSEMIVWGGHELWLSQSGIHGTPLRTGARYDPASNRWTAASTVNAPVARVYHSAVWTGSFMIVWGGYRNSFLNTGGRYALGHSTDDDGDGLSECVGDCNDAASSAYPGAFEICDSIDNDCDGVVDEEFDLDADGYRTCAGDCDDSSPSVHPGAPEACNGLDDDCDGALPPEEADADGDGVPICDGDCDDGDPGAFFLPGGIASLDVDEIAGGIRLTWESQAPAVGEGTVYDVFSGFGTTLRSSAGDFSTGSCMTEDVPDAFFDYLGPDPPSGDAVYFMIRAQNGCGAGTYGDPGRDAEAGASPAPCQ